MGLFGSKKPTSFLGIDIGASSVKIVELSAEKGRAKLLTYGYGELENSDVNVLDRPKEGGALIRQICKEAGCKSASVMAAMPTADVFSAIVALPSVADKKKVDDIVNAEIEKLTPMPLSQMITHRTPLDKKAKIENEKSKKSEAEIKDQKKTEKEARRILVTGSAKTLVQKYIELFKEAKMTLQALDTEAFALVRSLIGKDKSAVMILDIGARKTNIIIVENGIPFVTRSINVGGMTVSANMAQQMQVTEAEVERMKRDLGNMEGVTSDLPGGLPKILEPVMQAIVNEIRYSIQLYANMELTEMKEIDKIILTGGSAHLQRLPEYLSNILNVNVYRGDPWARIAYPKDLSMVLQEIGPRMSSAVGLAMRDLD